MILKALADYYERLLNDPGQNVAPPGFEKKAIPFLIVLDRQGRFVTLFDTRTGEGKDKTARSFLVPQGVKKTVNIAANLLWDNPQYVLGFSKEGSKKERDLKRARDALIAFIERIDGIFGQPSQVEAVWAVQRFLSQKDFDRVFAHEFWKEIAETNANLTFILESENKLIVQDDEVIKQIMDHTGPIGRAQVCAVSGVMDTPAILHTAIKGVWGSQTSGANIVSFNNESFCSFNKWKKQGLNAPISQRCEFGYTTALNIMLAKGSRQRMQVGDASTVFWARENHPFEKDFSCFLGEPPKGEEPDYGRIRALLSAVRTGVLPTEDHMPFYVLGLAPNAARIAIRFWYAGTVFDLKHKIALHFSDIEMVRAPHDREFLSLFQLLVSTAAEGKAENIAPNLGGEVARAVLNGTAYPRTLMAGALRRCKAEQKATLARVAAIKGFLARQSRLAGTNEKEVQMALDTTNENIGYVLGRLFAVLERIQENAHTGQRLNKTIRDTFFSAASSSPLVTFKRLQDLAVHHLAKIRNSGKSTIWLEMLMQEVMDKIPARGIPATIMLDDQGRFAVGYYHQRQDFFTKQDKKPKGGENE